MDINPFDQFAGQLNSALPAANNASDQSAVGSVSGAPPGTNALAPPQFNLMPTQPPVKQPVMNNGGYGGQQMGYGGGMGQQPGAGMMGNPMGGGMNQQNPMGPNSGMMMPSQSINQAGFNSMVPAAQPPFGDSVGPGALVPSNVQSNPYALGPPHSGMGGQPQLGGPPGQPQLGGPPNQPQLGYGQPPQQNQNAMVNPFGGPPPQQQMNPYGAPQPQQQQLGMDPFAPAPTPQLGAGPAQNTVAPSDPWGAPPAPPQQNAMVPSDPWGAPQQQPPAMPPQQPAPQIAPDPWGAPAPPQQSSALVPSSAVNDDPFGIFGAAAPAPPPVQPQPALDYSMPPPPQPLNDDPWSEMGFGSAPQPAPAPAPFLEDEGDLFDGGIGAAAARQQREAAAASRARNEPQPVAASPSKKSTESRQKGELPPGGEWYDAKIFTPTLGVMFFKPKELVDSLFLQTDKKTVEALEDRPVVAFIVEGSSARSAGVELGHVLLKVNGIDVKNPKEASRLIKEGPRPLPLLFYVPNTQVVVAEGEHMVKYNTKETSAPNSAKDWKPKYVVIGGIIAQPWMMNMYRSKVR
jgi:hypothetical protein